MSLSLIHRQRRHGRYHWHRHWHRYWRRSWSSSCDLPTLSFPSFIYTIVVVFVVFNIVFIVVNIELLTYPVCFQIDLLLLTLFFILFILFVPAASLLSLSFHSLSFASAFAFSFLLPSHFLIACYATLHPTLSVRPSVGPSIRLSVRPPHFTFLYYNVNS